MCGICGFAGTPVPGSPAELLERMCARLTHRGPDDQGTLVLDGMGLGIRRLSIIDLDGGHQPIHNEDQTQWVVLNGEIYNFRELAGELTAAGHTFYTRSDTEAIVHAYEQWGEDCVAHLNGMFAFAIWDTRRRALFLARDRLGIKPLYYTVAGGRLLFASELKALLEDPEVSREVDPTALNEYLRLEYVPSPRSIIAGVFKLPPGHTLTWHPQRRDLQVRQYWDVNLERSERAVPDRSLDEHAAELLAVIKESVRMELVSDVPLGVFLSGGIDSSAVAAMMAQLSPGNVNSFSIGFTDRSFDESRHARTVAAHLGLNHRELILEPQMMSDLVPTVMALLDEPLGDASIIPTYLLSRFAREHVKVALGGDGGDELFAGYPTLQAHRLAGFYEALPSVLRDSVVPALVRRLPVSSNNISLDFKARRFVSGAGLPLGERHARWLGSFSPAQRAELLTSGVQEAIRKTAAPDPVAEHLAAHALADPINQVLYLDMKLYLENDILAKVDRASMMASLEARVPLLNVNLVEYVTALPVDLKLRRLRSKYLLRYALKGLLPRSILERPKKGFGIPVAHWVRGPLKEHVLDAFAPQRIAREGFFDPAAIRSLLDDHLSGRMDNRKPIWTLFAFEAWYQHHLADREPLAQPARRMVAGQ